MRFCNRCSRRKKAAVLGIYLLLKRRKRRRRLWRKPWVARHDEQGAYNNLMKELELYGCLRDYLRITKSQFLDIVQRVTPILQRKNTNFRLRAAITPEKRVAVTLRFLVIYENFTVSLTTSCHVRDSLPDDVLESYISDSVLDFLHTLVVSTGGAMGKTICRIFSKSVNAIWTKFAKSTVLVAFKILLDFRK